jgi:hypothetical protein
MEFMKFLGNLGNSNLTNHKSGLSLNLLFLPFLKLLIEYFPLVQNHGKILYKT